MEKNETIKKIDTNTFAIRPFDYTDTDYAAVVKIINQIFPNDPITLEIYKHNDSNRKPNYLKERFVGEIEIDQSKQIVATGFCFGSGGQNKSGKYHIELWIDQEFKDQGLHEPLYEYLVAFLADKKPTKLSTLIREDIPKQIEFLRQNGYQQTMREPRSEIDVASFDFAPFAGYPKKVATAGIEIIPVKELQPHDANWMQKLYELENAIQKDVPRPDNDEFTPATLEEYAKKFKRPNIRTDAWFVAVDGAHYVGISSLWPNPVLKEILLVGITGVLPSHRRRGIATALKLKTIEFAQANGGKIIETDNEENNPMYDLNMQLGFKPKPGLLHFEKVL